MGEQPEQLHRNVAVGVRRVRLPIRLQEDRGLTTRSGRSASPTARIKPQDTRILPFIRFEDNEAHTMKFFCLNLRGVTPPGAWTRLLQPERDAGQGGRRGACRSRARRSGSATSAAGRRTGPRTSGTTGVFIDGLDVVPLGRGDLALDHGRLRVPPDDHEGHAGQRHPQPTQLGLRPVEDNSEEPGRRPGVFRGVSSFRDDLPPTTVITHAVRDGDIVCVEGVHGGHQRHQGRDGQRHGLRSTRGSFAEWEIDLDAPRGKPFKISASAEDVNGNAETSPHVVVVD